MMIEEQIVRGVIDSVIFRNDPQHGLQTADGLANKGFGWSHLGASCLTGSCDPERRSLPGNCVITVVRA